MIIKVKVPGSCGELLQGTYNGVPYLITCPVNIYTEVTISPAEKMFACGLGSKSQHAITNTLKYLGYNYFPYKIELKSELPIGKGMASSSADIAAVTIAVAATFGETLTPAEISRLAAGIEPTDGIFFPGIVRMNHMTGECLENFGSLEELKIAAFDYGGEIDTLSFHEREDLLELSQKNEYILIKAIEQLRKNKSPEIIAEVATKSALANQVIIHKNGLENIIKDVKSLGALGVNIAHSGTVIGILFEPNANNYLIEKVISFLQIKYRELRFLQKMKLIAGGYEVRITR